MTNYPEVALVRSMSWLLDAQATIAHNLANVDTAGFKRRGSVAETGTTRFQTMLQANLPTVVYKDYPDWGAGSLRQTGNHFDVSLDGLAFFKVQDKQGFASYTRDGAMRLDEKGRLVNRDGACYLDVNGQEISLLGDNGVPGDISITGNGTITDPADGRVIGQLGVHEVPDTSALQAIGNGRYLDTRKQTTRQATGNPVRQGAIETSNVDSLQEMVRMITVQRSFNTAQKALSSMNRMQETLSTELLRA